MLGIFLLGSAPLLRSGVLLLMRGQYVTQQYWWRNAPIGVDVITLALGNPFNSLWGGPLRHLYARLGIDLIESGAWLGIAPMIFAGLAMRQKLTDPVVRRWVVLGSAFFVADRIAFLHEGRIRFSGPPDEARASQDPFLHEFLHAA